MPLAKTVNLGKLANRTMVEWYTPPEIIGKLGVFDLDPCAAPVYLRPFPTAKFMNTRADGDGLRMNWHGRVWLNPPYGRGMDLWLQKLAEHGNGIALINHAPDSKLWHETIYPSATGIFVYKGRIKFLQLGSNNKKSPNIGNAFVCYGKNNVISMIQSGIPGAMLSVYSENK